MDQRFILWLTALAVVAAPSSTRGQDLEPDRPDVTNGTHIVDVGLLQIEFGGLLARKGSSRAFASPFTARVGLTEWLEARAGTDGLLSVSDGVTQVIGLGNVQLGAKLRLWADPGGAPVLSILPTVNLPAASSEKGLGSGEPDYTVAALTGTDIGRHVHLDVNYGIGAIGSGANAGHFVQHLVSMSLSDAISDNWNPYVEAFWFSRQANDGGNVSAIDAGAIYDLGRRYALDGGVQFGLGSDAPPVAVFAGMTMLVGDVLGSHGANARQRKAQRPLRKAPTPRH